MNTKIKTYSQALFTTHHSHSSALSQYLSIFPVLACLDNMIDISRLVDAQSAAHGIANITHEPAGTELANVTPASKKRKVCHLGGETTVRRSKRIQRAPTVSASSPNTKAEQHIMGAPATAVSDSHEVDDNLLRNAEHFQKSITSRSPAYNIGCEDNDSVYLTPTTITKHEFSYMEDPGLRHRSKRTQHEQAAETVRRDGINQGSCACSTKALPPKACIMPYMPIPSQKTNTVPNYLSGTFGTPSRSSCSSRPPPPDFGRGRSSAKNTKPFEAVGWNKHTSTPRAISTRQKHALRRPPVKSSKVSNTPVTPKTCIKRCPRTKTQCDITSHSGFRGAMPGMTVLNGTRVADPVRGKMADGGIIVGTRRGTFRY